MAVKYAPRTTPVPTSLTIEALAASIQLSWAYTPTFDFTRFEVYRDGVFKANTTNTTYEDTTGADGVSYDYTLYAVRTNPRNSREYRSLVSNTATGGWSSASSAEIEIVSVASATSGVTVTVNAVTGADGYRLYRSSDPVDDTTFAQVGSDFGTTTLTDTTGAAGSLMFYKVAPVTGGVAGTKSVSRVGSKLGSVGGDAITLGALDIRANIDTLHIELTVSGDANFSARAHGEFTDGTGWRHCFPMERVTTTRFLGVAVELDPDTPYTVQVTVTDSGGVSGAAFTSAPKTTRAENIPTYAAVLAAATHHVNRDTGNDAWNGQSATFTSGSTGPLKTLDRAIELANAGTIASGSTVKVSGYQPNSLRQLTATGVDWVAANAAIDAATGTDHAPYAATTHTIVYGRFSAPTSSDLGAADAVDSSLRQLGKGGWQSYNPSGHPEWAVYYLDVGATKVRQVGYTLASDYGTYAEAKAAEPRRCIMWKTDGTAGATRWLNTLDQYCEFVHTNLSYNAGGWQATGGTILYLVLPDGLNPNDCYIWIGRDEFTSGTAPCGFDVAAADVNITGFNFRALANSVRFRQGAADVNCFRNYSNISGGHYVPFKETDGEGSVRVTIQDFRCEDSNLWDEDQDGVPWLIVKQKAAMTFDSARYAIVGYREGDSVLVYALDPPTIGAEATAVKFNQGGRQYVIRRGEVKGVFNGVGSTGSGALITTQRDVDVQDMRFEQIADNCIEPEGASASWTYARHAMKNSRSYLSTDSDYGAHWFYRITSWQWGQWGLAPNVIGQTSDADFTGGNGQWAKFGAQTAAQQANSTAPKFQFYHVTAWTNKTGSRGFGKAIGNNSAETFRLRNCIFRTTDDLIDNQSTITIWDSDYNLWGSEGSASDVGWTINNVHYNSALTTGDNSLAAARLAGKLGAHDNNLASTDYNSQSGGRVLIDGLLLGRLTGDLSVTGSAPGKPLPNLHDDGSVPVRGYEG